MTDWPALIVDGGNTLLDHFKLHLGIDPADISQDEALSRALNSAGPTIESYLDRVIAKREVLEQFPHHFGTVVLHNYPVDPAANVTVYLNGEVQIGYELWMDRGGLAHLSRIGQRQDVPMDWRGYDQVGVTYSAGYDPLPTNLADAINWTAQGLFAAQGTGKTPTGGNEGVKSMTIYDVGSIKYDTGDSGMAAWGPIPGSAVETLQRYKRVNA